MPVFSSKTNDRNCSKLTSESKSNYFSLITLLSGQFDSLWNVIVLDEPVHLEKS